MSGLLAGDFQCRFQSMIVWIAAQKLRYGDSTTSVRYFVGIVINKSIRAVCRVNVVYSIETTFTAFLFGINPAEEMYQVKLRQHAMSILCAPRAP